MSDDTHHNELEALRAKLRDITEGHQRLLRFVAQPAAGLTSDMRADGFERQMEILEAAQDYFAQEDRHSGLDAALDEAWSRKAGDGA